MGTFFLILLLIALWFAIGAAGTLGTAILNERRRIAMDKRRAFWIGYERFHEPVEYINLLKAFTDIALLMICGPLAWLGTLFIYVTVRFEAIQNGETDKEDSGGEK